MNLSHGASWVIHEGSKLPGHADHLVGNVKVEKCDIGVGGVGLQQPLLTHLGHQPHTTDCGQRGRGGGLRTG